MADEALRALQRKLARTKETCDDELNRLIDALAADLEAMPAGDDIRFFAALEKLHGLAVQLLETDLGALSGPLCRKLVSTAQALQGEWEESWGCRHYTTAMLLVFSRVSRVVERMENLSGELHSPSVHVAPDVLVRVSSVDIVDNSRTLRTASEYSESELSMGSISAESRRSPSGASGSSVAGDTTVCRICEARVFRDSLRNHSRYCAVVQKSVVDIESCDELLLTLLSTMERRAYNMTHGPQKATTQLEELSALEALISLIKAALDLESATDAETEGSHLLSRVDALVADDSVGPLARRLSNAITRKASSVGVKVRTIQEAGALLPRESYEPTSSMPSIKDFSFLKTISRGSFGHVYLARKRATGDYYAIKVLRKKDLVRKNQVESIRNERNILTMLNSPFVTKLYYCFQSVDYLYIVMEYANGGDLFSLMRTVGALGESWARFYIAEVVVALEHIHALGIVHRDIKPDNLLINKDGHIKLADFGLSRAGLGECHWVTVVEKATRMLVTNDEGGGASLGRKNSSGRRKSSVSAPSGADGRPLAQNKVAPAPGERTETGLLSLSSRRSIYQERCRRSALYSCVGTTDYLAPEVILGIGHDTAVDWWATGVCLYEFLAGAPPFFEPNLQDTFANILERNVEWPDEISPLARDLINRLLTVDVDRRLGSRGAEEVKAHPFFAGLDWQNLASSRAAYVPTVSDYEDTSKFVPGARNPTTPRADAAARSSSLENAGAEELQREDGEGAVSLPGAVMSERPGERSSSDDANASSGAEPDPQAAIADPFGDFHFKNCNLLDDVNQSIVSVPPLPDASIAGMRRESRSSESIGQNIDRHLDCLVVEDNPVTQRIVDALLKQIGISVTQSLEGATAVRLATEHKYDLIFMDIMMPGMDGEKATELIRRAGLNRKTPIIAFTAMGDVNLKKGFNDILAKPFTKVELYRIVQKWLKNVKAAREEH